MSNKNRSVVVFIILILIGAAIGGYYYYQSQQDKILTLYGNVDVRTVNLGFRVSGKLKSLSVDEGAKLLQASNLAYWMMPPTLTR